MINLVRLDIRSQKTMQRYKKKMKNNSILRKKNVHSA